MPQEPLRKVRTHLKERQWLQDLGKGDLVEGAKRVVQQLVKTDNYQSPVENCKLSQEINRTSGGMEQCKDNTHS